MQEKFIEFDGQLINVKEIISVEKVTDTYKGQYGICVNIRNYNYRQEWFKTKEDRDRRFNEIKEDLC